MNDIRTVVQVSDVDYRPLVVLVVFIVKFHEESM